MIPLLSFDVWRIICNKSISFFSPSDNSSNSAKKGITISFKQYTSLQEKLLTKSNPMYKTEK